MVGIFDCYLSKVLKDCFSIMNRLFCLSGLSAVLLLSAPFSAVAQFQRSREPVVLRGSCAGESWAAHIGARKYGNGAWHPTYSVKGTGQLFSNLHSDGQGFVSGESLSNPAFEMTVRYSGTVVITCYDEHQATYNPNTGHYKLGNGPLKKGRAVMPPPSRRETQIEI